MSATFYRVKEVQYFRSEMRSACRNELRLLYDRPIEIGDRFGEIKAVEVLEPNEPP